MDRHSPDILRETTEESAAETIQWLADVAEKYPHVKPILTPRFLPSCTDELLEKLGDIQKQHHLPVQSHLSENRGEVACSPNPNITATLTTVSVCLAGKIAPPSWRIAS